MMLRHVQAALPGRSKLGQIALHNVQACSTQERHGPHDKVNMFYFTSSMIRELDAGSTLICCLYNQAHALALYLLWKSEAEAADLDALPAVGLPATLLQRRRQRRCAWASCSAAGLTCEAAVQWMLAELAWLTRAAAWKQTFTIHTVSTRCNT